MSSSLEPIPLDDLALVLVPALLVIFVLYRWSVGPGGALYALGRMLVQLLAIGYLLTYLFDSDSPIVMGLVLLVMLLAASWIAIRPAASKDGRGFLLVLTAVSASGLGTLAIVLFGVLKPDPWYTPSVLIPIAGMIFASAMTATSLAIERLASERCGGVDLDQACQRAFRAALIPQINSLLSVGLVTLPGMMTGQIISGVSPLIAVRYQIVVMCMIFGAAGLSTAVYLYLAKREEEDPRST